MSYSPAPKSEYIVEKKVLKEYLGLKRKILFFRGAKAFFYSILIILKAVLYYLDIVSDILLAVEYFKNGDVRWGETTLSIVIISYISSVFVLLLYCKNQLFYLSKRKQYKKFWFKIVSKCFEMIVW